MVTKPEIEAAKQNALANFKCLLSRVVLLFEWDPAWHRLDSSLKFRGRGESTRVDERRGGTSPLEREGRSGAFDSEDEFWSAVHPRVLRSFFLAAFDQCPLDWNPASNSEGGGAQGELP